MSKVDRRTIVHRLAERGFTVTPEAASALAGANDPLAAVEATVTDIDDEVLRITVDDIPESWSGSSGENDPQPSRANTTEGDETTVETPRETEGGISGDVTIGGDVSGRSTGTGEYAEFVALFRDRLVQLSGHLTSRVSNQTAGGLDRGRGGSEAGMIGMINDIRSTRNGHWLVELEDTTGTFPVLFLNDREVSGVVDQLLHDEVIGVEGRLSDDAGILFVEDVYFPDIPRTYQPQTADRPVEAALVSDVHVGSKEFLGEAWRAFADWLHGPEAERVEYLVIAGDMVEGVGVYPNQDSDLEIIDVYAQYERFAEVLKAVPGDIQVIMIPGNHDAVRLAEPQPSPPDDIIDAMDAHDAIITSNPSTVTIEGVPMLLYHGASLDEIIARLPAEAASYERPERAMMQLLKKRHLAPVYGGSIRIAPEERDYLVIDEVPSVFHAGHVHTVGVGDYRGVRVVNSGCWQSQTDFQRRNNLQPQPAHAPILELDTLEITVRKFN